MERYVAIDNVCAWPNLTRMPDGSIIATIFNQPTHGGWEGDVECWSSEDAGRTWVLRGVPAPHEPGTNRMNVAAGLARDGSLIVLASGWNRRLPPGTPADFQKAESLPVWICRSGDKGRTWERIGLVEPPTGKRNQKITPFGDIVHLTDGQLGVCFYGWSLPNENNGYFYSSPNDGQTWKVQGTIQEGNINETTPVVLADGRLLAAARTLGDQHLELFSSSNQGRIWKNQGPLTLGFQHPGHLLVLKDDRLLLTYGIRNKGLYGVGARLSADQGETWDSPIILVNLEDASDVGYPSSVQAEDGTVVTAYYCSGTPSHQRYHMGVIRWQIDEFAIRTVDTDLR